MNRLSESPPWNGKRAARKTRKIQSIAGNCNCNRRLEPPRRQKYPQ
jgi:hypothetical protein